MTQALRSGLLVVSLFAAAVADGCKGNAAGVAELQTAEAQPFWALAHRDVHGWTLHALNGHATDAEVDDLEASAVPAGALDDDPLIVHGVIDGSILRVDATFLGIPGPKWSEDDVFVRVKDGVATQLNLDASTRVPALDLSRVEIDGIDRAWLEKRIRERGAVLAGQFMGEPGGRGVLGFRANEVFVPLPDRTRQCPAPVRVCPRGMARAYERDADRCLVPDGCVAPSACGGAPPTCASGFVLRTWRSARGCREYVCDPSFLSD